jgi:hypothetical protein
MKYFLHDCSTGDSIDSTEAQVVSLSRTLGIFSRLAFNDDTFFGLIRDDGKVLQFAGESDGQTILVDIPVATRNGSLQLRTVRETVKELIQEFFGGKNLEEEHRFEFHKW